MIESVPDLLRDADGTTLIHIDLQLVLDHVSDGMSDHVSDPAPNCKAR